jgi:glycosyltransferase involved in cell wall biosynthesis
VATTQTRPATTAYGVWVLGSSSSVLAVLEDDLVRILICSLDAPLPPPNGLRLQVSALVRELSKRHEIRVIALLMPDQLGSQSDKDGLRLIPPPPRRATRAVLGAHARALRRRRPRGLDVMADRLRPALREELERFDPDVTHVTMGQLAALGDEFAGRRAVLAALDAWHVNYEAKARAERGLRRRLASANAAAMRRFEATEYRQFNRVVVVSEQDACALKRLDPGLEVSVVTNGVDVKSYSADPNVVRDPHLVLFTGVLNYPPNATAANFLARRVMPRVRGVCPQARLAIVGRSPPPRVTALAEQEGVEVIGDVPEMRPWLSLAGVYICPMVSGSGIKNKLLEALANGLGCIATPLATQGLAVTPGRELFVGSDDEELARHVVTLVRDPHAAAALGRAGRRYVIENHSWESVSRAYERIYLEVLGRGTRLRGDA